MQYHEFAAEALYLMAMIYDKLGRPEEREEAAALFKKHITALEIPQNVEPNMAWESVTLSDKLIVQSMQLKL